MGLFSKLTYMASPWFGRKKEKNKVELHAARMSLVKYYFRSESVSIVMFLYCWSRITIPTGITSEYG